VQVAGPTQDERQARTTGGPRGNAAAQSSRRRAGESPPRFSFTARGQPGTEGRGDIRGPRRRRRDRGPRPASTRAVAPRPLRAPGPPLRRRSGSPEPRNPPGRELDPQETRHVRLGDLEDDLGRSPRICPEARQTSASIACSAAARSRWGRPRSVRSPTSRSSRRLASVTVGFRPPWPKQAGPGRAPALWGPTWRPPATDASTQARLPPPMPTVWMSTHGTATVRPYSSARSAAETRLAVLEDGDVGSWSPPCPRSPAEERRSRWVSAAPATAPPAGPERMVCSGDRRTSSGVMEPPADSMKRKAGEVPASARTRVSPAT